MIDLFMPQQQHRYYRHNFNNKNQSPMILKYMKHEIKLLSNLRYQFAQAPKKRTQAPRYTRQRPQHKIDPKDIDYSKIPQDVRKGVKAYVQATNVLVASEAELETMALRQVILEEREKFLASLEQAGVTPTPKVQLESTESVQKKQQENYYDLIKAMKFMTYVSNGLMAVNFAGFGLLLGLKKFEYLGFFLGLSINPSIISLTGLAIGFNAAAWIIIQSLHLSIKDPNELSPQKISLTNCSFVMYLQALSIGLQAASLGYYLMQPNPFANMPYLMGSYALSQIHLVLSILRATNGFKFEIFSRLLIAQLTVGILLVSLVYGYFSKIEDSKDIEGTELISNGDITEAHQGILLARGYKRFLEEFKEKKIAVVKGEAINQIITDELK